MALIAVMAFSFSACAETAANVFVPYYRQAGIGVIISWSTEGKKNAEGNIKTAVLTSHAQSASIR